LIQYNVDYDVMGILSTWWSRLSYEGRNVKHLSLKRNLFGTNKMKKQNSFSGEEGDQLANCLISLFGLAEVHNAETSSMRW
jgi:hypothetical protein